MPRDAGRNAQTLRILGLLEHLASLRLGASLEDLAEHCGVETRTIRRDFDAIEALGYGIDKTTVSGRTRYRLDRTFASRIPRANLNVDELTALLLAFDSGSHAMPYGSQLASARRKIEQALPEPLRAFMIDARAALTAHLAPPLTVASATQARYLQDLIAATREHRQVMMGYGAAYSGTRKRYRLEPYRVVASQGAFYLVAWVPSASHWRVFALHRIESVTLRETHFEPAHTLAADPFGHSLGPFIGEPEHVEIRFSAVSAPYVTERRWHSSQVLRPLPGKRLHVSLDVSIDYALKSWILGFGRNAEVVAPAALVAWQRDEALAMRQHDGSGDEVRIFRRLSAESDARRPLPDADHLQAALPFTADWHPSPPVIVADAHGAGASDEYDDYVARVVASGRTTAAASARSARRADAPASRAAQRRTPRSARKR